MGSVYVGTNKIKKIYVGTTPVKKVYVGTKLVWSANETGYWNPTDLVKRFGGNHFYFVIYFAVLEKDYANNRMRVKYEVGMVPMTVIIFQLLPTEKVVALLMVRTSHGQLMPQFRHKDIKYSIKMREYGFIMLVAALFQCQLLTLLKLMYQE